MKKAMWWAAAVLAVLFVVSFATDSNLVFLTVLALLTTLFMVYRAVRRAGGARRGGHGDAGSAVRRVSGAVARRLPPPEPPEPGIPEPEPQASDEDAPNLFDIRVRAMVLAMPRAIAGDEDGPDHWLRVTNPGPKPVLIKVTGRDEGRGVLPSAGVPERQYEDARHRR